MIQFSLFGIPVRVEPWFWATTAFLGGALYATSSEDLLKTAMFMLAAFVSVLIHEMGHAMTIKKFRLPTQVVLTFMGGYATYPPGILSRKKSFLVTLAGPAVQLIFGILVYFLRDYVPSQGKLVDSFFFYLVFISIVWAVFNCLPIYPMDGGQMLGAILGPRRSKALHMTGMITAGLIGAYALTAGFLFMALFMGMFGYQNFQLYQQTRY